MSGPQKTFVKQIRVFVSPGQLSALERVATLTGVTFSDVVRRALDDYLSAADQAS